MASRRAAFRHFETLGSSKVLVRQGKRRAASHIEWCVELEENALRRVREGCSSIGEVAHL
jgi:hypothetical protein